MKLKIKIVESDEPGEDEYHNLLEIRVVLILPEVEKELLYASAFLEEFDSPEFVMDWLNEIKGDAVLLECEYDDEGMEERLERIFYCDYEDDDGLPDIDEDLIYTN